MVAGEDVPSHVLISSSVNVLAKFSIVKRSVNNHSGRNGLLHASRIYKPGSVNEKDSIVSKCSLFSTTGQTRDFIEQR